MVGIYEIAGDIYFNSEGLPCTPQEVFSRQEAVARLVQNSSYADYMRSSGNAALDISAEQESLYQQARRDTFDFAFRAATDMGITTDSISQIVTQFPQIQTENDLGAALGLMSELRLPISEVGQSYIALMAITRFVQEVADTYCISPKYAINLIDDELNPPQSLPAPDFRHQRGNGAKNKFIEYHMGRYYSLIPQTEELDPMPTLEELTTAPTAAAAL